MPAAVTDASPVPPPDEVRTPEEVAAKVNAPAEFVIFNPTVNPFVV
jgi:hypothetical protein